MPESPRALPPAPRPTVPRRRAPPPPAEARADPLVGRVVARCRLESLLGGGATAVVYRALHEGLGRPVAVKILRPQAAASPGVLDSFRREGRAIARIDSENVLKVYDVVDEGNLHVMVMELLEGESVLDFVAARGPLRKIDALRILRQAAQGLTAAHAQGIVHRDVKPQNLIVLPDGTVKLVDFGLALAGEGGQARVGTPHYVAPETVATGSTVPASDVYSLGVTLYHLLVGQPPYAGRTVPEVLRAHRDAEPMPLEAGRPKLGRDVLDLFQALTAHDPALRPTAAAVVETVDRFGGKSLQRKKSLRRGRGLVAKIAGTLAVLVFLAATGWVGKRLMERQVPDPGRAPAPVAAAPGGAPAAPPAPPRPPLPPYAPRFPPPSPRRCSPRRRWSASTGRPTRG